MGRAVDGGGVTDLRQQQPRRTPAPTLHVPAIEPARASATPAPLRSWRSVASAAIGSFLGVVPHVLHHVGLLAGVAVLSGATGSVLMYVLGLAFTVPLLRRLHRRFRTWAAPAIATGVFTGLFALSTFVIGPALSGTSASGTGTPTPTVSVVSVPPSDPSPVPSDEHVGHHP